MMKPIKKNILIVNPPLSLREGHAVKDPAPLKAVQGVDPEQPVPTCRTVTVDFHHVRAFHDADPDAPGKQPSSVNTGFRTMAGSGSTASLIQCLNTAIMQQSADGVLLNLPFCDDQYLCEILSAITQKHRLCLGITRCPGHDGTGFDLPEAVNRIPGLSLIQWRIGADMEQMDIRPLWGLSKQGIWNHFQLVPGRREGDSDSETQAHGGERDAHSSGASFWDTMIRFIGANPNIAHSYETLSPLKRESHGSDGTGSPPVAGSDVPIISPYNEVTPLPGRPLWQALGHPVPILACLDHLTLKALFLLRTDTDTGAAFSLGRDIAFYFSPPEKLPAGYLDEICRMVIAGGSVATRWVRHNLERAYLIGYAVENGVIVGNSSLKRPRDAFIQRINRISGMDFTHHLERGYTSVRPEYRALGVGAKLLEGLTAQAGEHKIFSIISEDNLATQKIAIRNNTRKILTYYSEQMGKEAGIWMPESMIDPDGEIS